jgi:hypothetical protein
MPNYSVNLATNVCSDLPICGSFVAPVEGALTCTPIGKWDEDGFPRAGGRLMFQLWGKICPNRLQPSLSYYFNHPIYLTWCAELPNQNEEYNPNEWVTKTAYFSTLQSTNNTVGQYRAYAKLTVPDKQNINVTLHIDGLDKVDGENVWNNWLTVTNKMPLVGKYKKIEGMSYKSDPEYIGISPTQAGGGKGDIYYISMIAGIEPLIYGCSQGGGNICNLWDGDTMKTCFRVLIVDKSNVNYPYATLMGQNRTPCGSPTTATCGCDECELVSISPVAVNCRNNANPTTFSEYVYTGWEPLNSIQSIQVAANGNGWQIAAKTVNGVIYFVWKYYTDDTWFVSRGSKVQNYNPTIYEVDHPASPVKLFFYVTLYPSPEIMPICGSTTTTPAPGLSIAFTEAPVVGETPPFVNLSIEEKRKMLQAKKGGCGCGPTPKFEG